MAAVGAFGNCRLSGTGSLSGSFLKKFLALEDVIKSISRSGSFPSF